METTEKQLSAENKRAFEEETSEAVEEHKTEEKSKKSKRKGIKKAGKHQNSQKTKKMGFFGKLMEKRAGKQKKISASLILSCTSDTFPGNRTLFSISI